MAETEFWALKPIDDLVTHLQEKRKDFLAYLRSAELWHRIRTSYRYFHGLFYDANLKGESVKISGPELEERRVASNQYRAVIRLLKTYIVAQKPEWDCIAKSDDYTALEATKLGNELLDSYMLDPTAHVEASVTQAVEDALVLSAGYFWDLWDEAAGEAQEGDLEAGVIYYAGDFRFLNPKIMDVVYDAAQLEYKDSPWVLARHKANKWRIIAQRPELKDKILEISKDAGPQDQDELAALEFEAPRWDDDDNLWVYCFYYKPSPELPDGRSVGYVGDVALWDTKCDHIPIHRIVPSQYMLTCFGYTDAFDLQPPQEALNALLSIILTNQNALGNNKIWLKMGEPVNQADLQPGVSVIQTTTPPQSLNFLQSAPELFKSVELYTLALEQLSGVNATSRGQAPPNLKSGAALAMMDSRTLQSASDLIRNYRQFQCDVGTSVLLTLGRKVSEPRLLALTGQNGTRFIKNFTGEMLRPIVRVAVTTGNPLMSTLAGRTNMAEFLAQTGLIKTPEELITVIKTGNLNRLLEHKESTLRTAQSENDALLRGEPVETMLIIDDHRFHILKHVSILDTPESRRNPSLAQSTLAHIGQHAQALNDPAVQQLQVILGYQLGMPMGPPGAPPPPGQKQATAGAPTGTPSPQKGKGEGPPPAVNQRVEAAEEAAGQA